MAFVIICIFLMGCSVIGIYCYLENYLLDLNRKLWEKHELKNTQNRKQTA